MPASTFEVPVHPAMYEARATFMAASAAWSRRGEKSTTPRPAAARTTRAAFEAIITWKVRVFKRNVSTSWASIRGCRDLQQRFQREEQLSFRYGPNVAGEAEAAQVVQEAVAEEPETGQVVELCVVKPQVFQVVEHLLQAPADQERAVGRQPADEQVERRRLVHPVAQVAIGHDQFIQVRQQPHVLRGDEAEGGVLFRTVCCSAATHLDLRITIHDSRCRRCGREGSA